MGFDCTVDDLWVHIGRSHTERISFYKIQVHIYVAIVCEILTLILSTSISSDL